MYVTTYVVISLAGVQDKELSPEELDEQLRAASGEAAVLEPALALVRLESSNSWFICQLSEEEEEEDEEHHNMCRARIRHGFCAYDTSVLQNKHEFENPLLIR
jgi:hypothetical protein